MLVLFMFVLVCVPVRLREFHARYVLCCVVLFVFSCFWCGSFCLVCVSPQFRLIFISCVLFVVVPHVSPFVVVWRLCLS